MRITKKVVSIILAVLMVTTMVVVGAVSVSATGDVAQVGDTTYTTLQDAFDSFLPSGSGTVKLIADCSADDLYIQWGIGEVTLDLNGKTLTVNDADSDTRAFGFSCSKLTVKDSASGGKITSNADRIFYTNTTTSLVLESGTIEAADIAVSRLNFQMTGGTINAKRGYYSDFQGKVELSGGTINATEAGIDVWINVEVVMSGGTINSDEYGVRINYGNSDPYHTIFTMKGGTISAKNAMYFTNRNRDRAISTVVKGGRIIATESIRANSNVQGTFTGGQFNQYVSPSSGYSCVEYEAPDHLTSYMVIPTGYTPISTLNELKDACANGGKYILLNDITITSSIPVTADNVKIDGNGYSLICNYQTPVSSANPVGNFALKTDTAKLTLSNLTLSGTKKRLCAVSANLTNTNDDNLITFNNVICKDMSGHSNRYGQVYLFSHAKAVFNDCEFANKPYNRVDGAADVWAGAAASVTVNNSSIGQIFLNSETTSAAAAEITDSEIGSLVLGTATSGETKGADVNVVNSTINTLVAPKDAGKNLTLDSDSTVVDTREYVEISGTMYDVNGSRAINAAASSAFNITGNVGYIETLGFQKKSDIPESMGQSDAETGKDIRFITHVYAPFLNAASDYGYVVAKTSKTLANAKFDMLTPDGGNGQKVIHCKGSYNTLGVDGTQNKYVTLAVNGVDNTANVAVRFFITINGKTYFSKYNGDSGTYNGCIAQYSDLFN